MKFLSFLFVASLLAGQLASVMIAPGVVVYLHDGLLVALLVVSYLRHEIDGSRVRLLSSLYVFFLVGLISLILHVPNFGVTLTVLSSLYLIRWFVYAEVYVLIASTKHKFPWLGWLYVTSVVFAAIGFVQYFLYPDLRNLQYLGWDPHYYRLFSTLLDPNFAGIILILGFFLGLGLWKKWSVALLAGEALLFGALLLTYSRSSYAAFIVGTAVYGWLHKRKNLTLGLLLLFFGAIAVLPLRDIDILRLDRAETAIARLGNWERGMELFRQSPVIGWGFDTLRYVQIQRHWVDDSGVISRAGAGLDNSFIFLLATGGIVGLASYLWILNSMITLGRADKELGVVLISSIAAISAHAFFINSVFYPWVMIWLWILVGSVEGQRISDGS